MVKKEYMVEKEGRISSILCEKGFSYNEVLKMLRLKDVRVNDKKVSGDSLVFAGDRLTVFCKSEPKFFESVFDGEEVLLVYKFAGIETETLGEMLGVFAVHRLDRNTEGLVVFAKNESAKKKLDVAFKERRVKKFYLAEVAGDFIANALFKAYLKKDAEKALVKIYDKKVPFSKEIETEIETLKHSKESSLLKVQIIGGKTHQIRAHLAFLGHPIIGDGKYGRREEYKKFNFKHQRLFAYKIAFEDVGITELNGREFTKIPKEFEKLNLKI